MPSFRTPLRTGLLALCLSLVAPRGAEATWSIIAVDTVTGEVAVASATCLQGLDLKLNLAVLRPGIGGAAAQAALGPVSNRQRIWNGLGAGLSPDDIVNILSQVDPSHQSRQYGIVDIQGRAATFTGSQAFAHASGVTGTVGNFVYAIQGNILTGLPVIQMAEMAFRNTSGRMPERMMAAMEAAKAMGGDGRCSCLTGNATSCGSPPPSFTRSSYVGFLCVARLGDIEGPGCAAQGCARGTFYLDLNIRFGPTAPFADPVDEMRSLFDAWRQSLLGLPDHLESTAQPTLANVPADGYATSHLRVALRDWQGQLVTNPNLNVVVEHAPEGDGLGAIQAATYVGQGIWDVPVRAPERAGRDVFLVKVDDGAMRPVTLAPYPELTYDPVPALDVTPTTISASTGNPVIYRLFGTSSRADRPYVLVLSVSGTQPGTVLMPGFTLPLNWDDATIVSVENANTPFFTNSIGRLDLRGRNLAGLFPPPGAFVPAIGTPLAAAWFTFDPVDFVSNPVVVTITP
ncbi:MAG: DUF1028 domain-containing protein [Planctomycetes bacterium]|nr:DUF1028 domain-containing protein [Planctomycetota bacterium]